MSNDNQFIQSTFDGAKKVTHDATPTPTKPAKKQTYKPTDDAPSTYVDRAYTDILTKWYDADPVDADAEIIGRDPWGRKVESHKLGWMLRNTLPDVFHAGDVVSLKHGFMASTLVQGMVYREEPAVIQTLNAPELIKTAQDFINEQGTIEGKNTSPQYQGMTATILDDKITVGQDKTRLYLVEVVTPAPLAGLKLLEYASSMAKESPDVSH